MAEVIDRHVENSVSGAIIHAQSQIEQGLAADDLDMAYIEEVACANAAREMVETYHGDSRFFPDIQAIARQSGPTSTHTNLPTNGQIFNARSVVSSSSNHRAINNRLTNAEHSSSYKKSTNNLRPIGVNPVPTKKTPMLDTEALRREEDIQFGEALKRSQQTLEEENERRKRLHQVVGTAKKNLQYSFRSTELPTPASLSKVNMNFLTQSTAAKPTPVDSATQNNPMKEIYDLTDSPSDDEDRNHILAVESLLDRALERSFDESASSFLDDSAGDDDTEAAVSRVGMITDNRDKALELTSLLVCRAKKNNTKLILRSAACLIHSTNNCTSLTNNCIRGQRSIHMTILELVTTNFTATISLLIYRMPTCSKYLWNVRILLKAAKNHRLTSAIVSMLYIASVSAICIVLNRCSIGLSTG